jgi:hypothetical protein
MSVACMELHSVRHKTAHSDLRTYRENNGIIYDLESLISFLTDLWPHRLLLSHLSPEYKLMTTNLRSRGTTTI